MAEHVAILYKRYIDLILQGEKTVESRLTRTPRAPFRAIAPGDRIYFKASSGPFMATAIADSVDFHEALTPVKINRLKHQYNDAVCGDDDYWNAKLTSRYATFVTLRDVEPLTTGPAMKKSTGIAWFVLDNTGGIEIKLTDGALRNRYVRVPPDTLRGDVTLILPDGKRVQTKVNKNRQLQWRGWKPYFAGLEPGATVRLVPEGNAHRVVLPQAPPEVGDFIAPGRLKQLVERAAAEDLGPQKRDVTSDALVPAKLTAVATMRSRETGVLCGAALFETIAKTYDETIAVELHMRDGDPLGKGDEVATFRGKLRSILAMERIALNFATHLSGVASLTARYVAAAGGKANIYDTRKTLPGLRALEKYAVVCGGGRNHRIGLYDAVLVKDNHIAHIPAKELKSALGKAIAKAKRAKPAFIEIEVDTLEQLREVLKLPVDVVLLDNMSPPQLREAAALRDDVAPQVQLEASGGVKLERVRAIAQTGVDRIAVGAITHSAPSLDLGLDILP